MMELPKHAAKRNQRNESTISIKHDPILQQQENQYKQNLITWSKERNKIQIQGSKSYLQYSQIPEPPKQQINKGRQYKDMKDSN